MSTNPSSHGPLPGPPGQPANAPGITPPIGPTKKSIFSKFKEAASSLLPTNASSPPRLQEKAISRDPATGGAEHVFKRAAPIPRNEMYERIKANLTILDRATSLEYATIAAKILPDVEVDFLTALLTHNTHASRYVFDILLHKSLESYTVSEKDLAKQLAKLEKKPASNFLIEIKSFRAENLEQPTYFTHVYYQGQVVPVEINKEVFKSLWISCMPDHGRLQEGLVNYHKMQSYMRGQIHLNDHEVKALVKEMAPHLSFRFIERMSGASPGVSVW